MQSTTLAKCIAIAESHFLYTPYIGLSIDKIYGVDGIENTASRICHYCSVEVLKNILETESLRFSDVRFLNDSTEFIEIISLLKNIVEQGKYDIKFKDIVLDETVIRELESYKFNRESIKEITLNPYIKEQESLFELGIKELLWENGIQNVEIYHSAIPMRKYF